MFQSFPVQRSSYRSSTMQVFLWPLLRQLPCEKFVQLWQLKVLSTSSKQWSQQKMWGEWTRLSPMFTLRLFAVLAPIRQLPGSSRMLRLAHRQHKMRAFLWLHSTTTTTAATPSLCASTLTSLPTPTASCRFCAFRTTSALWP